MSSLYVRQQIKQFLDDNSAETVVDLTADYPEFKQLLSESGVQPDAPWLGLQFIGDDEFPIELVANNSKGKYREVGSIYFHVADVAKLGSGDGILNRGEDLRNLLRGSRIGDILIESVTPLNFEAGATLQFEGGYMAGSFQVSYQRDINL